MKKSKVLVALLLCILNISAKQDSLKVLEVNDFVAIVREFHPLVKQAALIPQQAREELRIAHGGWDPKIYSDFQSKSYDGQNYFSYFENSLKIPVWYGIEVTAGYDFAYGSRLNSETKLPTDGLGYVGISVPLGKNLVIDKQRAILRQAQIFREASEFQKTILLNDALLDALQTYYRWSYAYREWQIFIEAEQLAYVRFLATVQTVSLGDRAAIDTTEALTQWQSRQLQQNEARIKYLKASFDLHNFLWQQNDSPLPFDSTIVPAAISQQFLQAEINLSKLDDLETQLRTQHPEIRNYNLILKQLDIERRLKIENLKPLLNLKYNVLSERFNFKSDAGIVFGNSYKLGVNFAMPLTFMQARGELKIAKLKITAKQYELDLKTQQLVNKLRAKFNELIAIQQQAKLYLQTVKGFKQLFEGESTRLLNGESSLFLVNARESRYLEAQLKLRELEAKYFNTETELKWVMGNMSIGL